MHAGLTWVDYVSGMSAAAGIVTFLAWAGHKLYRGLRRIEDLVNGELRHNGGGSIKDMVDEAREDARIGRAAAESANIRAERIEVQLAEQHKADLEIAKQIGALEAHLDIHVQRAEPLLRIVEDLPDNNQRRRAAQG